MIGDDPDGDGTGEPVPSCAKPTVQGRTEIESPATNDEFEGPELGLQWQWPANPSDDWWSLTERPDWFRLRAAPKRVPDVSLWDAPRVLLQKLIGPTFIATTSVELSASVPGMRAGLVVLGRDYAYLALETAAGRTRAVVVVCRDANAGGHDVEVAALPIDAPAGLLRLHVDEHASGHFSFSRDGRHFEPIGEPFAVRSGVWVGARVGLFCFAPETRPAHADFDWFRVE